jgi:hypothetical protein
MDQETVNTMLAKAFQKVAAELDDEMVTKTPAGTVDATQLHGAAGIFATPGLSQDVITAHVRPHGIFTKLPGPYFSTDENPIFGGISGYTAVEGDEPTNACEDAPAGYMKGCDLTARFGMIRRDTKTIEIHKVMRRINRSDFKDLRLVGEVLGLSGVEPSGLNQGQILNLITMSEMVNTGVQYERKLLPMIWQGSFAVTNEFPGLDNQIQTGQVDAGTGTACPAFDSDVKSYNYQSLGPSIVTYLSSMMWYLEYNAMTMGLDPVDYVIAMRPGLWQELTEIWPCAYHTNRCSPQVDSNASVTLDGRDNTRERDAMRAGMYIYINGIKYNVVTDTGIFEHNSTNNANLIPGEYASSIYAVPLRINGNYPATYMEFMDYKLAMPDMALLKNMPEFWWTDNGMFFWAYEGTKWCYKLSLLTEPRIILRAPQLAGRIDYVKYSPLQHERESDPASSYFFDGGTSLRDLVSAPNAVWN